MNKQIDEFIKIMEQHNIFERFNIDRIGIFGSITRNEYSNDIDVLIEDNIDYHLLSDLRDELENLTHKKVDIVMAKYANPIVLHRAKKEIIYVAKH